MDYIGTKERPQSQDELAALAAKQVGTGKTLPGFITNLYAVLPSEAVQHGEPFHKYVNPGPTFRWPLSVDIKFLNGGLNGHGFGLPPVYGHLGTRDGTPV